LKMPVQRRAKKLAANENWQVLSRVALK